MRPGRSLCPTICKGALIGQAQTSFGHPLFIAEQFSLDGSQAASAYPLGTFSVDEGATLRGEIQRAYPFGWTQGRGTIAPYIFGAASQGWIDDPTAVQPGHINAESFGVGCASARIHQRQSCHSERPSASNSLAGFRTSSARARSIAAMSPSP
jgi:hypothetical protein